MARIKLRIEYDGTDFVGYQVQLEKRTVQLVLEKALKKMHDEPIRVYSSGRTDSGVHALDQVLHFDTTLSLDDATWQHALTTLLPKDIRVKSAETVAHDFHARKDATNKTYRYIVLNRKEHDVFRRNYEWHIPQDIDLEKMKEAAKLLKGKHDFTAFAASKSNVKGDKTRTIFELKVWREDDDRIYFEVTGDGFLTHMVRIMVGTLIEIGQGKKDKSCITKGFESLDRRVLGLTAPGHGLYLWEVEYE
ncbi:tRNA pseudouridine(38-40) synthase TruA [Tenuibacillus multivorans]|uniref:tRNA pseudouridine synthase A n=1 Tax=Tenuibacillus multivorans TaxID=237069 RepID=A0A1H0F867_9BACI|nr:tRNA pseudouridine(38-40) synthase TruA [Tenuibacillus multivorans]GEL78036.1 tRNA pseudouridine synthase A 1 [Tenuibacillus multivorans]SDN90785.1 tRNA pseudouridine38-40 synthase [Tenuibacillus multivorans]